MALSNSKLPPQEEAFASSLFGDDDSEDTPEDRTPRKKSGLPETELDPITEEAIVDIFEKDDGKPEPEVKKETTISPDLHVGDSVIAIWEGQMARGVIRKLSEGIDVEIGGRRIKVESAIKIESCQKSVDRLLAGDDPASLIESLCSNRKN